MNREAVQQNFLQRAQQSANAADCQLAPWRYSWQATICSPGCPRHRLGQIHHKRFQTSRSVGCRKYVPSISLSGKMQEQIIRSALASIAPWTLDLDVLMKLHPFCIFPDIRKAKQPSLQEASTRKTGCFGPCIFSNSEAMKIIYQNVSHKAVAEVSKIANCRRLVAVNDGSQIE